MLACGMDPKMVMAEPPGRSTGYSKGKEAPCICSQKAKAFMEAWNSGAQVPIGAGIALQINIKIMEMYALLTLQKAPPIKDKFMKPLIWLRFEPSLVFVIEIISTSR